MSHDRVRLLQLMPVFGAVSGDTLAFILERSHDLTVPEGGFFFREGSEADGFYVLESGSVEILREHDGEQVHLTDFEVGDCFGEMAIVECRNRNASVRALENCVAVNVPLSALHELYEKDLEQFVLIQMNLAREISRRLSEAAEQVFTAKVAARELGGNYRWYLS